MKKLLLIAFVIISISQFHPKEVYALSCVQPPAIEGAYEEYDAVVVGHVDEIIQHEDRNEVRLTLSKSFKGIEMNKIAVNESITWGSLWGPSKVGEEYLFFLRMVDGSWENPLCSPTKRIVGDSAELDSLRGKEIPLRDVILPVEYPKPAISANAVLADSLPAEEKELSENSFTNWIVGIITFVVIASSFIIGIVRVRSKK